MSRLFALLCAVLFLCSQPCGLAQLTSVPAPGLRLEGLRSANAHGSFKASAYLPDGSLVLLYDQGNGLRLLKTDASVSTILAQTQQGGEGDSGVALSTDSTGNIYVAGTSSSGQLSGTSGAAFPAASDSSLNSFLARFDSQLHLIFLTFLGAGRTEVTGVAVTQDAVFVTGANYNGSLPTTPGALQRTPPNLNYGSGNGFVQRFTPDGTSLRFATYLNGADGGSVPAAVIAGTDDSVYIAGETSASSFPVLNALQPAIAGSTSGFLAHLAPDGGTLLFSTFIAGSGLSSLALDSATKTLLGTGDLAFGQFPVAQVSSPLAQTPYQGLLRLSSDGQTLLDSILLLPGAQSSVLPGPDGTAWVSGSLSVPVSPETMNRGPGDSYVLHVAATGQIDQLQRIGGTATSNPAFARLNTSLAAPALSPDGLSLTLAGTIAAQTDSSFRGGQSFDLTLNAAGSSVLPNSAQDLLPPSCAAGQGCAGSAGLLAQLYLNSTPASLTLSTGDPPNLVLRNIASTGATGLTINAGPSVFATNCSDTLEPFAQCSIRVSAAAAGTLSITSSNAPTVSASLPSPTTQAPPLVFNTPELDFGIVTVAGSSVVRSLTVQNLGDTLQTFSSAADNVLSSSPYTLTEVGGTCAGPPSAHTLAPQSSCTVQIGLTASDLAQNDGPVQASWRLGSRAINVTGFTQAASLSLSASEIDFGPGTGSSPLRYLYLSNSSSTAIPHSTVSLPSQSPFSVLDGCPAALLPSSVCQITLSYSQPNVPAFDSITLTLDAGPSVLLTGETLPPSAAPAPTGTSPLVLSPNAVQFVDPVPVSQQSAEIQTLQLTNPTAANLPIAAAVLGDFSLQSSCGASLPAGSTCSLSLTFAPSQPGTRVGLLLVSTTPEALPSTVRLQGTAIPLLSSANGTLDLGETTVGEPVVTWVPLQGSFPQLTVTATGPGFSVALLADNGYGHGTVPPAAFAPTATAQCTGCWLAVQFLPEAPGAAQGTVHLATAAGGNPYRLALQAVADPAQGLVLTPAQGSFGAVAVGSSSAPLRLVLTNLLANATPASIQAIRLTGDFALATPQAATACADTLQPTTSCSVDLVFVPTSKGQRTGTLTVTTIAGTATATLLGIGFASPGTATVPAPAPTPGAPASSAVRVFPTQADFGPQPVATISPARQFTLSNTSSTTQILTLAASRNFPLALPSPCSTLAAGSSCNFTVSFVPTEGGPLTGSITITSTAQGFTTSTQTVLYLKGYGVAAGGLTLSSGTDPQLPVSFGSISDGLSASQTLTLTNTGTTPHTIRRLVSTTPFQATTSCTQALAPGDSCEITVTYAAVNQLARTATQTPRSDLGTLLLESDTDASPTTVYLQGIALPGSASAGSQAGTLPTYTLSPSALTFPNTQPGTSSPPQVLTAFNNGVVPVTFGALLASAGYGASTTCSVLQPGATCTISVLFHPTESANTGVIGSIGMSSNAAAAFDFVSLLGTAYPAQLRFSAASLDFGPVPLGKVAQQSVTVTNLTDLPLSLGPFSASGDFSADASGCPQSGDALPAGQSCTLSITFTPSAPGSSTGTLTGPAALVAVPQSVSLSGTGTAGKLQSSPASVDFGSVPLTTSTTQSLTLTNAGTAPLQNIALALTGTSAPEFGVTSTTCTGSDLAVGATCIVQVSFAPSISGPRTASLAIASTDPSSPTLVPLAGTGSEPPGFTLSIRGSSHGEQDISSGASALFPLTLTSQGGYTGPVALLCTPIAPAPNAGCALASTQLVLTTASMTSSVSISTQSGLQSGLLLPFGLWSLLPCSSLTRTRRKRQRPYRIALTLACAGLLSVGVAGCGRGPGSTGNPYTPPGTYQYQVTAASTSGPALSSSVTLTVIVH